MYSLCAARQRDPSDTQRSPLHDSGVIEFNWDAANMAHLDRHGVTPAEFEQAMTLDPEDIGFQIINGEERYTVVGPTNTGRLLYMVWTLRGEQYRAITAYDAPLSVRRAWEERRR